MVAGGPAPPLPASAFGLVHRPALIVGMTAEARIARRSGWLVCVGGGGSAGAEAAVRAMLLAGADGLISLGLAGGLNPTLAAGDVVVPSAVITGGVRHAVDLDLAARLGGADGRAILGTDTVVATGADKQRLWRTTGAVAADLESGAVALTAAAAGVPFAALRVICDPADRDLPPAALVALGQNGAIGLGRVLMSVLRYPAQLPSLLRLAGDARTARRSLLARVRML